MVLVVAGLLLAGCDRSANTSTAQRVVSLHLITSTADCVGKDGRLAWSAAWRSDSVLALLERGEQRVLLCTVGGGAPRMLGRRGEGPGEFEAAFAIASAGSAIAVADARLRRVTVWDSTGNVERVVAVPGLPAALFGRRDHGVDVVWVNPGAMTAPVLGRGGSAEQGARQLFALSLVDSAFAGAVDLPQGGPTYVVGSNGVGEYYIARNNLFRIAVTDSVGRVKRVMGRPDFPIEHFEQAEVEQRLRGMAGPGSTMPQLPDAVMKEIARGFAGKPKPVFGASAFQADGTGLLWVLTTHYSGDSTEVDLFGQDGQQVATAWVRDTVRALAVRSGMLAVVVDRGTEREELPPLDVYQYRLDPPR